MMIDTHAHLDFPEFSQDLKPVLSRAAQAGVREIITIGIDINSSELAAALAGEYAELYAAVGIHPHCAYHLELETLSIMRDLACRHKVVAIGEIGLDYYRDRQPREIQRDCFRQQLELACELGLPVVFHIRNAYDDFLAIIKDYISILAGGIIHCFSGDWEVAKKCLDMGFFISIPGTVTFAKSQVQQDVVERAPIERLLIETDAPYLAPVPYRGKPNEPSFVQYTAKKIAELKSTSFEEICRQTTANAHRVFRISSQEAVEQRK
ncbi:MAG: TatD family hydrolase [Syntrophobacteraceae bacterium]